MDGNSILGLLAVVVLVALNGFFVSAEFALVSVRRTRIDQLVSEGKSAAKAVQRALNHLDGYIAATQLGITLASLALGWVGEPALSHLIGPAIGYFVPGGEDSPLTHTLSIIISFSLITAMHIVLGELAPKTIALQRAEATAMFVTRPLDVFRLVFKPFIIVLNSAGQFVVRLFGFPASDEHSKVHSVEELEMLVSESREAGYLDDQEEVLLRRVFDFNDKTARQVMTPRTEVVGIPHNANLETIIALAANERYTRYPVYRESLDSIIGIVHLKDIFTIIKDGWDPEIVNQPLELGGIMREPHTVPETAHVADLLTEMRAKRVHMAIIIDEYGGTAGVLTLEDIMEELVGDVRDEFDTEESGVEPEVITTQDGVSVISGLYSLSDALTRFNLPIEQESLDEFDTIGGFVQGALARIPRVGDQIEIGTYYLQVIQMDGLRLDRLKLVPQESGEAQNQQIAHPA